MSPTSSVILSIVTVSYETRELTLKALESVVTEINRSKILKNQTEILVVDNNSKDGSALACRKFLTSQTGLAGFQVLSNQVNLGFAQANNLALKIAQGKYFLLLNSDTIVTPMGLENLIKTFESHPLDETSAHLSSAVGKIDRLGLLSPTLLNPDGSLQHQGGDLPNLWTVLVQMSFLDDLPLIGKYFHSTQHTGAAGVAKLGTQIDQTNSGIYHQGWISGTALGIRREVIEEIGVLDENIFMYGEDMEYCLRASNHHWDIAIDQSAFVIHYGQASSSSKNAILGEIKGYLYLWSKHFPASQLPILKLILHGGMWTRFWIYQLLRQSSQASIYAAALKLFN